MRLWNWIKKWWRSEPPPEYRSPDTIHTYGPIGFRITEQPMSKYDELWEEFQNDTAFTGSFTDWMVRTLEMWENTANIRMQSLEDRVDRIRQAPTVPREQHEVMRAQYEATVQQLEFERRTNAVTPDIRLARASAPGAPNPGRPDPLRGHNQAGEPERLDDIRRELARLTGLPQHTQDRDRG